MSIADISEDRLGGPRPSERTPPHDLLAEQSALGGMMLSKDAVADVIESLRGPDFYVPKHELIFEAILSLYSHGEPTDVVAVTDELIKSGELSRAGGPDYLHSLTSIVPTAANAGLLRVDRPGARTPSPPRGGRHAHRADGVLGPGRGARPREQRPGRDLLGHGRRRRRGLRAARGRGQRGHRRDRGGARARRADDRHPDRLRRPRPAHQRPAPRPDDHHRRPSRDG